MMIAVTAGMISSCEKPTVDAGKKPATEKSKAGTGNIPDNCPGCGMG